MIDDGNGWGCGKGVTWPVGGKPKGTSPYGALDMAGNVWEWVSDWYGNYTADRQVNPTGPATGAEKAVRGGAYDGIAPWVRAAIRLKNTVDARYASLGFRCAGTSEK